MNDTNSCRESKGLWTYKNNWQKQASLIASAPYAAFARNGVIYKSSSEVLQDKLILTLMSIMMRDGRYVMWSWSMPPWILGNLSFGPSAVMCAEKKEIWQDLLCGWKDEKVLSISLCLSPVLVLFIYLFYFLLRDQVDALVHPAARWANDERENIAASIMCSTLCVQTWIYERVCVSIKSSF